jgi:hypothetical protein
LCRAQVQPASDLKSVALQVENLMNSDIRASVEDLNNGILTGRLLEVFDKYYADNCVMSENGVESPDRVGKANNRAYEEYFVNNATFHGARVDNVIVDGNNAAVTWWMDIEMGGNRFQRTQVAVQTWENGQIVKETFFYGS